MRRALLATGTCAALLTSVACGEFELTEYHATTETPVPLDITFRTGVLPLLRTSPQDCTTGTCHRMHEPTSDPGGPASGLALGKGADTLLQPAEIEAIYAMLVGSGGGLQRAGYGRDVNVVAPASSLLLAFPLQNAEGGDATRHQFLKVWRADSPAYRTILGWIENDAPND